MNIRKLLILLTAGIANSSRAIEEAAQVPTLLDTHAQETSSLPVEKTCDTGQAPEMVKVPPVTLSVEERLQLLPLNIDDLVVASDAYMKTEHAKKHTEIMKQLIKEILTSDMVFCKLLTVLEQNTKNAKFWGDFKISLRTQQEFEKSNDATSDGIAMVSTKDINPSDTTATTYILEKNEIRINMIKWKNYESMPAEKREQLIARMRELLTHELHHYYVDITQLPRLFQFDTKKTPVEQRIFLTSNRMHMAEFPGAPYKTKNERDELLAAFKACENKIEEMLLLIKKCDDGKCTQEEKQTINFFNNKLKNYKGYHHYLASNEITASDLKNLLLQLKKAKYDVNVQVPQHIKAIEFDAKYFGIMSGFLEPPSSKVDIFRYLFSDLIAFHNKYAPKEYKKCMKRMGQAS